MYGLLLLRVVEMYAAVVLAGGGMNGAGRVG